MAIKRIAVEDTSRAPRRIRPTAVTMTTLRVSNIEDGETVYQQCVLVKGECPSFENSADDYVTIKTIDAMSNYSSHNWPVHQGKWKALVLLASGNNDITVTLYHAGGANETVGLKVTYQPLLQVPPLYLAILVAKDSPLLIDCPPSKYGAITSTHNDLDAAIIKLRMAAYTWQALTAEDMREKGLGRRAFRLEEEWGVDTMSIQGFTARGDSVAPMKSLAKVHVVRSELTVAELRDPMYAQQNRSARRPDELHAIFTKALKAHGAPFDSSCRPVVAGLILDSHYSLEQDLILGHAALGCHNRDGLSLGIFGSHLTYSWPRCMEEVPACLIDGTAPGDTVGNDNNECKTMARACFIGQGAMLHEVGHAFGADHTTGIMKRGYSKGWGTALLCHSTLGQPRSSKHESAEDDVAEWDLQDVLRFKTMPHFRLPGDEPVMKDFLQADIYLTADGNDEEDRYIQITSGAGLARVDMTDGSQASSWSKDSLKGTRDFITSDLSSFDRGKDLEVTVLAMNGKQKTIKNVWRLFEERTYIQIPGSNVKLQKQSVKSADLEEDDKWDESRYITWNVMLSKLDKNKGTLAHASDIDLRVGCTFDGAVVYYDDNSRAHCGPTHDSDGRGEHHFGGHASEQGSIPRGAEIVKVEINSSGSWGRGSLDGIRMTLDNGASWGELHDSGAQGQDHELVPGAGQKIIGFFGTSAQNSFIEEFGIITGPKDFVVDEQVLALPELRNNLVQDVQHSDDGEDYETCSQDTL